VRARVSPRQLSSQRQADVANTRALSGAGGGALDTALAVAVSSLRRHNRHVDAQKSRVVDAHVQEQLEDGSRMSDLAVEDGFVTTRNINDVDYRDYDRLFPLGPWRAYKAGRGVTNQVSKSRMICRHSRRLDDLGSAVAALHPFFCRQREDGSCKFVCVVAKPEAGTSKLPLDPVLAAAKWPQLRFSERAVRGHEVGARSIDGKLIEHGQTRFLVIRTAHRAGAAYCLVVQIKGTKMGGPRRPRASASASAMASAYESDSDDATDSDTEEDFGGAGRDLWPVRPAYCAPALHALHGPLSVHGKLGWLARTSLDVCMQPRAAYTERINTEDATDVTLDAIEYKYCIAYASPSGRVGFYNRAT